MTDNPKIDFRHHITVTGTLTLTEAEMGALEALAGYGADPFLKVFYEKLGEAYMKKHEIGLRSLFNTISATVPLALRDVRAARTSLTKSK